MPLCRLMMMALLLLPLALAGCVARGPVRTAVYADAGAEEPYIGDVVTALASDAITCDRIMQADVVSGKLAAYDVIVFPGGTGNGLAKSLGSEGCATVTEFAKQGGGVIGICAGGYLCAEGYNEQTRQLELVNARLWDLDHWERGEGTTELELVGGERATLRFENAPIFEPGSRTDLPAYVALAHFVSDPAGEPTGRASIAGHAAAVAAPFGQGRVVLFGPHPERTPGQEYLLRNAALWAAGRMDTPEQIVRRRSD